MVKASSLGGELRRLRRGLGLTLAAVGSLAGIRRSYVHDLESGRRMGLSAARLFRLADALKVPTEHFRPYLLPQSSPET